LKNYQKKAFIYVGKSSFNKEISAIYAPLGVSIDTTTISSYEPQSPKILSVSRQLIFSCPNEISAVYYTYASG